jgi:hypothetical protein
MTLISTVSITSNQDQISVTGIPATYTDLYITVAGRTALAAVQQSVYAWFNNGSNLTHRFLLGTGSSVSSGSGTDMVWIAPGANATSNTFGNTSFYVPNYASSTNKSVSIDCVTENNSTASYQYIAAALWSNTAAINQFNIYSAGQNFVSGTTMSVYGILKGSGGATVS